MLWPKTFVIDWARYCDDRIPNRCFRQASFFVADSSSGSGSVLARAVIRDRFEVKKLVQEPSLLIMAASLPPTITPFISGYI